MADLAKDMTAAGFPVDRTAIDNTRRQELRLGAFANLTDAEVAVPKVSPPKFQGMRRRMLMRHCGDPLIAAKMHYGRSPRGAARHRLTG